ncbi:MAG: CubicO group peptidase (beta-lactamase class C family) [Acidimicrobiales bacterium]|jgi:CubicO group peptidase (beta-lactamase class C family)
MSTSRLERIAPAMQTYIDNGSLAGISTMVSRRGEIVHAEQVGFRDKEAGLPMTADTIFRIYSMTKPIVSTALMLLHEEGRFQITDPVANYLPAFGKTKVLADDGSLVDQVRPMQVRELLMHTSGLTYDFMEGSPADQMYRDANIMHDATRTLEQCIDALAEIPLAWQPGTRWHYSVGIDVAARLVEVISGQSLGQFLSDRMFEPLGMSDSGFGVPESEVGRLSAMYGLPDLLGQGYSASALVSAAVSGYNERADVSSTYPTNTPDVFQRGGLGLFSTISDYMRFAQMLVSGGLVGGEAGERLISRKTLQLMHTNHVPADLLPFDLLGQAVPGMGFGLGSRVMLDLGQFGGTGSEGEFGWAGAAKTYYWVDPAEELVGVFMSQYMTGVLEPDRTMRSLVYQAIDD